MKKETTRQQDGTRLLSEQETMHIRGGSIVSGLLRFAKWGAVYFFRMGYREGKATRATL